MHQTWVVRKVDNTIQWITHYPTDGAVCFVNTYPLDSDLPSGSHDPAFEQLGPGVRMICSVMIFYCFLI